MIASGMLQSSGEEQGSVPGVDSRDRAKASGSDVHRAASMLQQSQRYCPHRFHYIHAP